jgi:septal ring factor EnvC (AmiA/AmiB activator)
MTIREEFTIAWNELTGGQKAIVLAVVIVIAGLTVSGWIDSAWSFARVQRYKTQAENARRDADDALQRAAKIASDIKVREDELNKVEAKRDEKQNEVDKADQGVRDARSDYERAVRDARPDTPGTDELCAELKQLGYPCG